MAVVARHAPGTFCWLELGTTDQQAATAFYAGLFGWTANESPMPDGTTYTMLEIDATPVAALYQQDPARTPTGVPPHWLAYVAVDDVGATAKAVTEHGGKVLAEPFEVMRYGRMAVCADPLGAVFALWQPGLHRGIGRVRENGALAWMQLNAGDPGAAAVFYQAVFGWTHRRDAMPQGGDYVTWSAGEQPVGGGMPMPAGVAAPAHWLVYFGAADVDGAVERALQLGGKALVPPTDIPGAGRFAVLADPQGAAFALVNFVM